MQLTAILPRGKADILGQGITKVQYGKIVIFALFLTKRVIFFINYKYKKLYNIDNNIIIKMKAKYFKMSLIFSMILLFSCFVNAEYDNTFYGQTGEQGGAYYFYDLSVTNNATKTETELVNFFQQEPDICDIDGDGIKELLFWSNSSYQIITYDGNNENLVYDETINIGSGLVIDDIVCLKADNTGYSNREILIAYHSGVQSFIKSFEYNSGSLSETHTYLAETGTENLRPLYPLECREYYNSFYFLNMWTCAYVPITYDFSAVEINSMNNPAIVLGSSRDFINYKMTDGGVIKTAYRQPFNMRSPRIDFTSNITYFENNINRFLISDEFSNTYYLAYLNGSDKYYYSFSDTCGSGLGYVGDICTTTYTNRVTMNTDVFDHFGITPVLMSGINGFCDLKQDKSGTNFLIRTQCYDDTLTSVGSTNIASLGTSSLQDSLFRANKGITLDFNNDGNDEICLYGYGASAGSPTGATECITGITGTSYLSLGSYDIPLHSVNYYDGFNYYEALLYSDASAGNIKLVYEDNTSTMQYLEIDDISNMKSGSSYRIMVEDISGDGKVEYIEQRATSTGVYFTKEPSPSTITTYGSVIFGYYDPACYGNVTTFEMQECKGTLDCTYTTNNADDTEQEKLCTDCGGTETYHCGAYSYTNPKVTCSNLNVGANSVDFDLYTDKADARALIINGVNLTINTGVDGVDCNNINDFVDVVTLGGVPADDDDDGSAIGEGASNNAVAHFFDLLTGQNKFLKAIIGIIITIALIVLSSMNGLKDPFGLTLVLLLGIVLSTFMGLFPIIALVLLGVLFIVFLLIYGLVFKR